MLVKQAGVERSDRYDRWYQFLLEEVGLVIKPTTKIFAVGHAVAKHLGSRNFPSEFSQVMHYGRLAARARAKGIVGHEDEFRKFRSSVVLADLIATARNVLNVSGIPEKFQSETLMRLANNQLTESRLKLIFNYKLAFENEVVPASGGIR
jgi:hypothetical protein